MKNLHNPSNQEVFVQKYLGSKGLIIFLALLSAFVPLSTDLYLPALPTMTHYFNVSELHINLTLIVFFIFFSIGTLLWGPLSDKYGRRPILLVGIMIYTFASFLCATSLTIDQLILFRILQGIGGGAASAVATAIVKDVYRSKKRESILAIVQAMVVVSPAIAPVIGALLLKFTSWKGVFIIQALIGIAILIITIAFQETIKSKSNRNIIHTIGRLIVVLKNPGFTSLLIIFSIVGTSMMAFIASSSYIYQETFKLNSQVYSYYFAFNAIGMVIGPLIYVKLSTQFQRFSIINACFAVMVLSGLLVYAFGPLKPWIFALMLLPGTIAVSCTRPPGTFLMLDQQKEDTGSASSLINSFVTIMGSLGIFIVSLDLGNLVQVVGAINIIFGSFCGIMWFTLTKKTALIRVNYP